MSPRSESAKPKRPPGWGWLVFVAVSAVLIASGFSVIYTNRAVRQMCGIVGLLADENPPPSTPRGQDLLREAKRLQHQYHCR